jgi:hypothetical protein
MVALRIYFDPSMQKIVEIVLGTTCKRRTKCGPGRRSFEEHRNIRQNHLTMFIFDFDDSLTVNSMVVPLHGQSLHGGNLRSFNEK